MRGQWEERFERRYGFWRSFVDEQVRRYLDCGLYENGFARVRCPDCRAEYLLAFSCKPRELCPSCAGRRAAATAVLLREEVLEEVGHAQRWARHIGTCRARHCAGTTIRRCGALRTMPMPGTPREARHTLFVPARMEAAGASSAWSPTFRLPYERPR